MRRYIVNNAAVVVRLSETATVYRLDESKGGYASPLNSSNSSLNFLIICQIKPLVAGALIVNRELGAVRPELKARRRNAEYRPGAYLTLNHLVRMTKHRPAYTLLTDAVEPIHQFKRSNDAVSVQPRTVDLNQRMMRRQQNRMRGAFF